MKPARRRRPAPSASRRTGQYHTDPGDPILALLTAPTEDSDGYFLDATFYKKEAA